MAKTGKNNAADAAAEKAAAEEKAAVEKAAAEKKAAGDSVDADQAKACVAEIAASCGVPTGRAKEVYAALSDSQKAELCTYFDRPPSNRHGLVRRLVINAEAARMYAKRKAAAEKAAEEKAAAE